MTVKAKGVGLAKNKVVVDVETWSIAHSDGKNMENTWDTERESDQVPL